MSFNYTDPFKMVADPVIQQQYCPRKCDFLKKELSANFTLQLGSAIWTQHTGDLLRGGCTALRHKPGSFGYAEGPWPKVPSLQTWSASSVPKSPQNMRIWGVLVDKGSFAIRSPAGCLESSELSCLFSWLHSLLLGSSCGRGIHNVPG